MAHNGRTLPAGSKGTMSCAICCQEKPNIACIVLSQCGHESCGDCLTQWIEKVESTGQANMPGCPFCRVELTKEEATSMLGRPYRPKAAAGPASLEDVDELTRQWIESQTAPCISCGARIEKIDGCDLMECLCGYRFCYSCGSQGATCFCTPPNHYFWDNVRDCSADRRAPPRAPTNQESGEVNLREHIERRRQDGACLSDDPMQGFDGSESPLPSYSPSTSPHYSPTYSPMSQTGRALALEPADYPNARQFGQPSAPPPRPILHPASVSSLRLLPLSSLGSTSPQYSVTSATFSPLHQDEQAMVCAQERCSGSEPVLLQAPREEIIQLLRSDPLVLPDSKEKIASLFQRDGDNHHKPCDSGFEPINGGWDD